MEWRNEPLIHIPTERSMWCPMLLRGSRSIGNAPTCPSVRFVQSRSDKFYKTSRSHSLQNCIRLQSPVNYICMYICAAVCVCVCPAVATTNHDSDVIMIRVSTPPHRCTAALLLFAADRNCSTRGVFPAVTFLAPKLQQCPLGAANKVLL